MLSKTCKVCKLTKPIEKFEKSNKVKRKNICSTCRWLKRRLVKNPSLKPYIKIKCLSLVKYDPIFAKWQSSVKYIPTKICHSCKERKFETDYHQRPDGSYYAICKQCNTKRTTKYTSFMRRNSAHHRILNNLSNRIRKAVQINKGVKTCSSLTLLGCDLQVFKTYLSQKFRDGMSWENYGKTWHIDHIRPCCSFDLTKPEEQKACFHFTNLQPLLVKENLSKSGKWPAL